MGLNNIILPASVVTDLYQKSLIEFSELKLPNDESGIKDKKPIQPDEKINDWKWLGENKKYVLILLNNQNSVHLPDDELNFLSGILQACKLSLADVAILNIRNHPQVSYKELTSFFKSKIVLLFAIEPSALGLPMNFPHYQIQPFAGTTFLYSPSLSELEKDKLLKSKLWVCLKRLFNI